MAARTPSSPVRSNIRPLSSRLVAISPGAAVLAVALPFLFLHTSYQPGVDFVLRGSDVSVNLTDVAALAVAVAVVAALVRRGGLRALAGGRLVWLTSALFLAVALAATFYPLLSERRYGWSEHLLTWMKFAEYAALAAAVPLFLRARLDRWLVLGALVAWSVVVTTYGSLQYLGVVPDLEGIRPLQREPSLTGVEDFAALSGAVLALALVASVLGDPEGRGPRVVVRVAAVSGLLGVFLSSALAGMIGIALAATAAVAVAARRRVLSPPRALAIAAVVAAAGGGYLVQRSADVGQFLGFVGVERQEEADRSRVQTYSHRTLLAYIGVRIWRDNPVFGVGWQASRDEAVYDEYLDDAHRRFPDLPLRAFPSTAHPWGIQNSYVQALAELGVVGLLAFLAWFVGGLLLGARAALRAPPPTARLALLGCLWLLLAMGLSLGRGLVAGLPLNAIIWLALGFVVLAAQEARRVRAR